MRQKSSGSFLRLKGTSIRLFRFLNLIYFDVSLAACALLLLYAKGLDVHVPLAYFALLFIAVWWVYAFDRLMDTQKYQANQLSDRHQFFKQYQNYFKKSMLVLGLVFIFAIPIAIPTKLFWLAIFILFLVILYFATLWYFPGSRRWLFLKEFWVATIFAFTPAIIAWSFAPFVSKEFYWISLRIWLLCYYNLLLLSIQEYEYDRKLKFPGLAQSFGIQFIKKILPSVLLFSFSIGIYMWYQTETDLNVQLVILLVEISYFLLLLFKYKLEPSIMRLLLEVILWVPLLLLVF